MDLPDGCLPPCPAGPGHILPSGETWEDAMLRQVVYDGLVREAINSHLVWGVKLQVRSDGVDRSRLIALHENWSKILLAARVQCRIVEPAAG